MHTIIKPMVIIILFTKWLILASCWVEKSVVNGTYLENELVPSSPCLGAVEDLALTNGSHDPKEWYWSLSQHRIGS